MPTTCQRVKSSLWNIYGIISSMHLMRDAQNSLHEFLK